MDAAFAFAGAAFTGAFAAGAGLAGFFASGLLGFAGVFAAGFLAIRGGDFFVARVVERLDVAPAADFARGFVDFVDDFISFAFAAGFLATAGFASFVGFFASAFTGFFAGFAAGFFATDFFAGADFLTDDFAVFFFADAVGFFTGFLLAMMRAPMLVTVEGRFLP